MIYVAAFKTDKNIQLEKSFPLNRTEKDRLNKYLVLGQISNSFSVDIFKTDSNKTTPSGNKIKVYLPGANIKMKLRKGSYSLNYTEIDKVGYVSDLTLFDKEAKILYYERKRYFPFQ